jgi:hypothetical protein
MDVPKILTLATALSEYQSQKIMAPTLCAGLTNAQICYNFPRDLIHAPAAIIGAEIPHLFTSKNIAQIGIMLTHGRSKSLMGQLLRATFEAFVIECGVGRKIFNPIWRPMVLATT